MDPHLEWVYDTDDRDLVIIDNTHIERDAELLRIIEDVRRKRRYEALEYYKIIHSVFTKKKLHSRQ